MPQQFFPFPQLDQFHLQHISVVISGLNIFFGIPVEIFTDFNQLEARLFFLNNGLVNLVNGFGDTFIHPGQLFFYPGYLPYRIFSNIVELYLAAFYGFQCFLNNAIQAFYVKHRIPPLKKYSFLI
ncbi:MAG: hypothetical protein BWY65_01079 [Firmicutes bacterium ADurb.Bin373]|nr:MAG: hypothetical protein BWY65_01079 [Firmicutes bacterium ADurb.Bin373]